jgi:hypothetical protein
VATEEVQKARTALINACYQTLRTIAEEHEKAKPILKIAAEKVSEMEHAREQIRDTLKEIKDTDPVPIEEYRRVKDIGAKMTLALYTARTLYNTAETRVSKMKGELEVAKKNYENAVKEPEAQIFLFPGTNQE